MRRGDLALGDEERERVCSGVSERCGTGLLCLSVGTSLGGDFGLLWWVRGWDIERLPFYHGMGKLCSGVKRMGFSARPGLAASAAKSWAGWCGLFLPTPRRARFEPGPVPFQAEPGQVE